MNGKKRTIIIMSILLIMLAGTTAFAQTVLRDRNGVAVEGYDVVAYFTLGEATEGNPEISAEHAGARYFFVSNEHRELFLEDPEAYLPQYGGYCAYAVSRGGTASIQPELWTIHDDRLFLNFNNRTHRRFEADLQGMITSADENWPGIRRRLEN